MAAAAAGRRGRRPYRPTRLRARCRRLGQRTPPHPHFRLPLPAEHGSSA